MHYKLKFARKTLYISTFVSTRVSLYDISHAWFLYYIWTNRQSHTSEQLVTLNIRHLVKLHICH